MTFKKNSESGKDTIVSNDVTKDNIKEASKTPGAKKKHRLSSGAIFALVLVALISFWAITTIVIPLHRSSGAEKYSGDLKELAENVYEFESALKSGDPTPVWLDKY